METNKCVSVIVPVYNVEAYIRDCLESIVNQTYTNLDIVLIDDGSIDNSGRICDEYASEDKRIRVVHKENGGLVSARKAGAEIAKGEYVIIVDSDDWIELNEAERVVEAFEYYDCDVVSFGYYKEHGIATDKRKPLLDAGEYSMEEIERKIELLLEDSRELGHQIMNVTLWANAYRKDLYAKYQLMVSNEIDVGEDAAVTIPLFSKAHSFYIDSECYYHYRARDTSIVHSSNTSAIKKMSCVCNYLLDQFRKKNNSKKIWFDYCKVYVVFLLLLQCPEVFVEDGRFSLYPEVKQGDRIAIFGKGVFGKNIGEILSMYTNVIGVYDSTCIEELLTVIKKVDYVIIAILSSTSVRKFCLTFQEMGIQETKIIYIKQDRVRMQNLFRTK